MNVEHAYRIYEALGNRYLSVNVNQAYLCFENAVYLSRKSSGKREQEEEVWIRRMEECRIMPEFQVRPVSIILLSHHNLALTKACLESIREQNDRSTYKIIIVDNASGYETVGWLRRQEDIILIENQENMGFPYGCNQGIERADKNTDILLLNNDTLVPSNAIFWLRMGLYESRDTGAAGSISNNAVNYQQVPEEFATPQEWLLFAEKNNVPMERPYEKKAWLMGFALLLKRTALEAVRENDLILDTRFTPGNYEDNDLGLRMLRAGYRQLLCKNSFIFHHGSAAFGKKREDYRKFLLVNEKKLKEKYGQNIIWASHVELGLLDMIKPRTDKFFVLQVGCRLGTTLAKLESRFAGARVLGLEKDAALARMASAVSNVQQRDFLQAVPEEGFDYILMEDILKPNNRPEELLLQAKRCLNPGGRILISVKNTQCIRKAAPEEGYSLDEIVCLFNQCGLKLMGFSYRSIQLDRREQMWAEAEAGGKHSAQLPLYTAEYFVFEAG